MKRVAVVVADLLVAGGIEQAFMVTGGGAMHLNDAIGRHGGLRTVFCHHEQSCAMAAESYARLTGCPALVNVTTGPGGINALNGVFGAHVDSIPMIVVSGQVKRETMVASYDLPLRQLGDQEVDIVALAAPVTKWATVLLDPEDTRAVIEQAIFVARDGRPGPVWVDIPIDVQASPVDPSTLRGADPEELIARATGSAPRPLRGDALVEPLAEAVGRLAASERPVVLVGAGVRLSGAHDRFLRVIDKLGVPVVTGWNAHDAVPDSHPLYVGRPGTIGDRAGNFAVQSADFLLVLGSRLNIRQISYNWQSFARAAYTVMVDVDRAELDKPTLRIDLPIHADLADVLEYLDEHLVYEHKDRHRGYLEWCLERRRRYPILCSPEPGPEGTIDPYYFLKLLFEELDEDDVIVTGDGSACVMSFQVADLKHGQRLYTNSGCASMGYDLPGAIGAAVARGGKRVICIAGDGSVMLNLQELQTIAGNHLAVKIFVLNNNGYSSIRQTQRSYFPDGIVGCDPASGLSFPDFVAVGSAFGIPSLRCQGPTDALATIRSTLGSDGPRLLEVMLDPERAFEPKLSSRQLDDGRMVSSPLEDLAPFLPRDELADNVLIPAIEEC